jgi:hypothetical protein
VLNNSFPFTGSPDPVAGAAATAAGAAAETASCAETPNANIVKNAKEKIVFENDLGLPNFFILKINYQTYFWYGFS